VAIAFSAMAMAGCQSADEDEGPPKRASHEFVGEVDPAYAGSWAGQDKMSGLELGKDGTAKILAATMSAKGRSESKIPGEWRVSKPSLLLRYKVGKDEVTLKYKATLKGDTLELIQAGNNHKNVYRRAKPASNGEQSKLGP